jgi:hypothetical protein
MSGSLNIVEPEYSNVCVNILLLQTCLELIVTSSSWVKWERS